MTAFRFLPLICAALMALPAAGQGARTALGIFESWGAFRDAKTARCYAIATPEASAGRGTVRGYASVGFWPKSRIRQQLYVRLTRERAASAELRLTLGERRFVLTGNGVHGWARDARMDAAIVAAMRSNAQYMIAESSGALDGRRIADQIRACAERQRQSMPPRWGARGCGERCCRPSDTGPKFTKFTIRPPLVGLRNGREPTRTRGAAIASPSVASRHLPMPFGHREDPNKSSLWLRSRHGEVAPEGPEGRRWCGFGNRQKSAQLHTVLHGRDGA